MHLQRLLVARWRSPSRLHLVEICFHEFAELGKFNTFVNKSVHGCLCSLQSFFGNVCKICFGSLERVRILQAAVREHA